MERRIRLVVQYDGTNYVGWQAQSNGLSVQAVLEKELSRLLCEKIVVTGSGRTDSGVHAAAQVVHFDTSARIPADKIPFALNVSLPSDIRILYGDLPKQPTEDCFGFHARYDVQKKHYRYSILQAAHNSAFLYRNMLFVHSQLDLEAMQRAAMQILGKHDFSAFKSEGSVQKTTEREIFTSEWVNDGNCLYYDICGSGFLYNMVRIIVGTMLDIGMGRRDESCIEEAFSTGMRSVLGATAPAHGLMMSRVEYDDFDTDSVISVKGAYAYGRQP